MKIDLTAQPGEYLRFEKPIAGQPWSIMLNLTTGEVLLGPTGQYNDAWTGLSKNQVDVLVEFLSQAR